MSRTIQLPNVDATEPSVSTFELRLFAEGELSAERRTQLQASLGSDTALQARLDAVVAQMKAEQGAFALEVPLPRFLDTHAARTESTVSSWFKRLRLPAGFSALAATAAAVLFLVQPADDTRPVYDGLKGAARIGFFVKSDDAARPGKAGDALHEGDRVQFAVRDATDKDVMVVVGIDGRGQVSTYAAERISGERSKGVAPTSEPRLLPSSVVLDDSTGAERFFVVYADGDVDAVTREVEDAARKLAGADLTQTARLPLDDAHVQSSVHIVKLPSR